MAAQAGTSGGTGDSRETARIRILKHRLDAIRLTTDGVVPLDLACASSREALLGPAGAAYMRSGIVVATAHGWLAQEMWSHGGCIRGQRWESAGTSR